MSNCANTIGLVGDLMLGRGVSESALFREPADFWSDVRPLLQSAGAVIGNLEAPITRQAAEWRQCWKAFRYGAYPCMIDVLRAGNIRAVSLANNHILDRRALGLRDTLNYLDVAGIGHAGAGRNLEEAVRPAIVDLGSVQVGLISITDTMWEFAAGPRSPGTNYVRISNWGASLALIECLVRSLREKSADLVILSAHWGPNLRSWPPQHFRRFARAAIDLGVDIFHGHSAHLVQGIEIRGRGVILYDTGNFLDDYWVFPFIRTDRSFLFLIDLEGTRPARLRMVPVSLANRTVRLAHGREAAATMSTMIRRCRRLGTTPLTTEQGLELDLGGVQSRGFTGGMPRLPRWIESRRTPLTVQP